MKTSSPSSPLRIAFVVVAFATLLPWVSSAGGLVLGILFALLFGNPYATEVKKLTPRLLAISVAGLGAGMNLGVVAHVGLHGIGYTIAGIATAFVIGTLLGKLLRTEKDTSLLITVGTAICGGSAIAAVAPVIEAKAHEVSVSLATVFLLNATALVLFPFLGHQILLDQHQFGLWSALAIHDTSSVVGATLQYGPQAVEVGTTVKLARALWIIPVTIAIGLLRARGKSRNLDGPAKPRAKKPWFILWFLIAAGLVTLFPDLVAFGHQVEGLAKRLMVLTLFLIGAGLSRDAIRQVGAKPFVQGIVLWFAMAALSLGAIFFHWIE